LFSYVGVEKDMGKKAVDVVLLPTEAMMDRAIEVNRKLPEKSDKKIVLNKKDCLPHISLAMGCVDEKDIADIEEVLQTTAKKCSLGELRVIRVRTPANLTGEKVSSLEIERTDQLQSLHEEVMEKLSPYLNYDVSGDMVYGTEVGESTLLWIKNYHEKSSFANFLPHITIGYGEIEDQPLPIRFAASKLALCHLGNHCTCRKILISVKL
jgi:2'-5' RNA ligase